MYHFQPIIKYGEHFWNAIILVRRRQKKTRRSVYEYKFLLYMYIK